MDDHLGIFSRPQIRADAVLGDQNILTCRITTAPFFFFSAASPRLHTDLTAFGRFINLIVKQVLQKYTH